MIYDSVLIVSEVQVLLVESSSDWKRLTFSFFQAWSKSGRRHDEEHAQRSFVSDDRHYVVGGTCGEKRSSPRLFVPSD